MNIIIKKVLGQSMWNTGREFVCRKSFVRLALTVKQHNKPPVAKNGLFLFRSCEISGQYLPTYQN